jgi:hypothetical protein
LLTIFINNINNIAHKNDNVNGFQGGGQRVTLSDGPGTAAFTYRKKNYIIKHPAISHSGGDFMGILGFVISLVSVVFLLIGLVPFLGWLNWFTTLPATVLGAIFCGIGLARYRGGLAMAGLIISVVVFFLATGRLIIGCGVI